MQNLYERLASGRVRAPEFPGDAEWIGTPFPLSLADLRGHVVLLDFWTFCCINCMHVVPELQRLERRFGAALSIIGVHSAKFAHEGGTDSIRLAMARYGISHPVVNDAGFRIWRQYGVRAWPTLVLIDPEGYAFYMTSGEGHEEELGAIVQDTLDHFGIAATPEAGEAEPSAPGGALSFPGKLAIHPQTGQVAVAETGNNRILVMDAGGHVQHMIGSIRPGDRDGAFETARFSAPQGVCFTQSELYIADTGNHRIRKALLESGTVETVAGSGQRRYDPRGGGPALRAGLNSPWDLVWVKGRLYVTMAGNHQIWVFDSADSTIRPFAGTGQEDIRDGSLGKALFAQPSGLAWDGDRGLFVADAETSAIRHIDLDSGRVQTLVGTGLFDFGDDLGSLQRTRLQHPLGVAWDPETACVIVADSYNDRLVRLDLARKESSLMSKGLSEPGGLAVHDGVIWVADTNAGRIVRVEPKAKGGTASPQPFEICWPEVDPACRCGDGGTCIPSLKEVHESAPPL